MITKFFKMKNIKQLLPSIFLIIVFFNCQAQNHDYCLQNVSIIDVTGKGGLLTNMDVYIKNDRISKINKSGKKGAEQAGEIINGEGKFLMPGLADMHVHIPKENTERFLLFNLAAGVTAVRSMRGDTSHLLLKRKIENEEIPGPVLFLSAPPFHPKTNIKKEALSQTILEYKKEGFDLIKVLGIPDTAYFEALMQAANNAEILVAGHVPKQIPVERVIQSGYSCIEHLEGLIEIYQKDTAAITSILEKLKNKGVYNCPTLDWYNIGYMQLSLDELKKREGLEYVNEEQINKWIKRIEDYNAKQNLRDKDSVRAEQAQERKYIQDKLQLVKKLNDIGAFLLLSPDATGAFGVPGFSMFEEMKLYSKAGIANKDILKIATYNPALYFGQADKWGSVNSGLKANLILLSENPLVSIENIQYQEAVFINGKYFKTEELKNRLK